eukprot:jgi/Tetstr1/425050/TSEL_015515.t1
MPAAQVLLSHMQPEHKFATATKLCHEVLAAVTEGSIALEEGEAVLADALAILAFKEIKVSAPRAPDEDAGAAEEGAAAGGEAMGVLKRGLVSGMMKKHLVEAVVPVLVELKRQLEAAHHPLMSALRATFCALLKDYKAEVEDILVGDRQLAKEILYDLKEAEQRAKEAEQAAAAPAAAQAEARPGRRIAAAGGAEPLPSGATAATPLAATVLRATAVRIGSGVAPHRTPFAPPTGGKALTPAAALRAADPNTTFKEPVSVPRLSRPSAGGAAASPVAPPAVVSLPGLDETSGEHPTGRQWNIPPEVADGTPARAARRGRRGALVDASNEPEEDASEGGDMDAQAAALSDPKAGASRRSTRAQRGKENPAAPAVKTEPVAATRSGRATRKRRA